MIASGKLALLACLGMGACAFASAAQPDTGAYGELATRCRALRLTATRPLAAMSSRAGYDLTPNASLEVLASAGISSGSISNVTLKVNSAFGGYVKARFAATPQFELYARVGFARVNLSSNAVSGTAGDSSFSYGVGAQYRFTKHAYRQADYTSLYDKDGVSIRSPAVSVGYRF